MIIKKEFGLLLGLILILPLTNSIFTVMDVSGDSVNPGIYSPNSSPFGIPYEDWLTKWWQWSMSIPVSEHPRDAYSEEKCVINQEGPVWFLADQLGGQEVRKCTVPAGKAILVPLLTGECDYGIPEVKNDDDLRRCAMAGNEYGTVEAIVDGVKLKNLDRYRTQSGFFNISIPEDNIYQAPAGNFRAMSDGYFVFLEPLQPGNHNLRLKTSVLNPIETSYNYNSDSTYDLEVTSPQSVP
jgi:hypothetical protein